MRTIILLFAIALIPTLTHGQRRPGVATFRSDGDFELRVSVDGQRINRRPSRVVKTFPMRPGRHTVAITTYKRGGRHDNRGHQGRGRYQDGYRTQTIHQTVIVRPGSNMMFSVRKGGRRGGFYVEADYGRYPERRGRYQDPVQYGYGPVCYDAENFPVKYVVREMRYRSFDRGKLRVAKDAICNDMLMAEDLRRMMRSLDFDDSRMELALYAHDRVCNIHDFHIVFDTFDFHGNRRRLKRELGYI